MQSKCSICGRPTPMKEPRYRLELKKRWIGDSGSYKYEKSKCEIAETFCIPCARRMRMFLRKFIEHERHENV